MKYPMPNPSRLALPIALALTLPLQAARLAHEGFDYTEADGTSVTGLNGGFGWSAAFPSAPNVTLVPGLSYPGLTTTGKAIRWNPNNAMNAGRAWADVSGPPANGTYWFSVLVTASGSAQGNFNWMFATNSTNGQNGVGFRTSNASGTLSFIPVHPNTDGTGGPVAGTSTAGTPALVVGRLTLVNGTDSNFRIWVNPSTDPATPPSDSDTNSAQTAVPSWLTANLRAAVTGRMFSTGQDNPTANHMLYDEIRIGQSFAEILPSTGADFSLSPLTAIENQTLTFTWSGIPAGSNPTLNGNPVTIDGAGNGGTTLPAPAANTTFSLTWDGAASPLTRNFTAIAPSFSLSPTSGYLGDTLTLNWRIPVGATEVTLNPGAVDLTALTSTANGIGTTTLPAPQETTTYTLSYTSNGSHQLQSAFTLLPSFLAASPANVINTVSAINLTWRIHPDFDEAAGVSLQAGPLGGPYESFDVLDKTNVDTGAGAVLLGEHIEGEQEYRLLFEVAGEPQILTSTISIYPKVFNLTSFSGANTEPPNAPVVSSLPMFDGVQAYGDRPAHLWAAIPSIMQGAQFIQLRQAHRPSPDLQITVTAEQTGTFFLLIDNRVGDGIGGSDPASGTNHPPTLGSVMAWVLSSGFVDSGVDIGLDESAVPGAVTIDQSYSVFFRQVNQGESFTFYEQNDGTGRNMYGIAAVTPQVTPVAFAVNPNVINQGENTLLQWTVPTGFTSVTLQPGNVDLTGETDPLTGAGDVTLSPAETTQYTLSYVLGTNDPVSLAPVTVTVNIVGTPFSNWMAANYPGITAPDNEPGANPDGDNLSNLGEFAFAGDPGDAANNGLLRSGIHTVESVDYLTYTLACRTGAAFTGAGPVTASVDGVSYTVRASLDLSAFTLGLTEVTPAITTGLPAAPEGYEYRTFRTTAPKADNPRAFIQAVAQPAP